MGILFLVSFYFVIGFLGVLSITHKMEEHDYFRQKYNLEVAYLIAFFPGANVALFCVFSIEYILFKLK